MKNKKAGRDPDGPSPKAHMASVLAVNWNKCAPGASFFEFVVSARRYRRIAAVNRLLRIAYHRILFQFISKHL